MQRPAINDEGEQQPSAPCIQDLTTMLLQCYYRVARMCCMWIRSLFMSPLRSQQTSFWSHLIPLTVTLLHTGTLFSKQSGVQCFNMCGPSHSKVQTHPSRMDSRQQYKLSNFCLVTESLTFMAGTHSFPALDSWYSLRGRAGTLSQRRVLSCLTQALANLWTPVTLSSTMPLIFLNTLGYFLYIQWVRSPPSSRI